MTSASETEAANPASARSRIAAAARQIAEREAGEGRTPPRTPHPPVARANVRSVGSTVNDSPSSRAPVVPSEAVSTPVAIPAGAGESDGGQGLGSAACTRAMAEQQRALGNLSTRLDDPSAVERLAEANAAELESC